MDVVSSYRTKGFCDHLASFGICPTLITHRWERDTEGVWKFHAISETEVIENNERCTIIRLPRRKSSTLTNTKIQTVFYYFKGIFEIELVESYNIFRQFLLKHLVDHKYDAILTIFSPHFQMKLANEMSSRFEIPYITDFRDLWDNQIVTKSYRPSLRKRTIDLIIGYWWKRWINGAIFFTTTNERWKIWLEKVTGFNRGVVVRNGFEDEMKLCLREAIRTDEFILVHFGRLYLTQDLSVFLQGFNSFVRSNANSKIKLVIIGHKPRYGVDIEKLFAELPTNAWEVHPYMNKTDLYNYCMNKASVFWIPGFVEDTGAFPVKVYDYLLMGKNILFTTRNDSDVRHVIEETQAGVVCNTEDEVREQLSAWYLSFVSNGFLTYNGNEEEIMKYARVNQVKILAENIHEYIR